LLQEVETQALVSQQKISQTQNEINARKREARLNQLTSNELTTLPKDTTVYEGVGKMYESVFVEGKQSDSCVGLLLSLLSP
jgi:prefoldin subunit 1